MIKEAKQSARLKLYKALQRAEASRPADMIKDPKTGEMRKRLPGETHSSLRKEEVIVERVLSLQQRRARAIIMRRNKAKLTRGRQLAVARMAGKGNIAKRSSRMAKGIVRARYAGKVGASYQNLSPSGKMAVDRLVDKKTVLVRRLAQRIVPFVKQAETKRALQHARTPTYGRKPIAAEFQPDLTKVSTIAERAYDFYVKDE